MVAAVMQTGMGKIGPYVTSAKQNKKETAFIIPGMYGQYKYIHHTTYQYNQ